MFDYKSFLFSVLDLLKGIALDNTSKVVAEIAGYMADAESRYESLAKAYSKDGNIDFVREMLKDEKNILESQANALVVSGAQISQDVINKIIDMAESLVRSK